MSAPATAPAKQPVSVLVCVHTRALDVLLIERADFPGFWQSVTGSREGDEPLERTALRELAEETGIDGSARGGLTDWHMTNVYEIYPNWRHRYPAGTTHNTEHVYGIALEERVPVRLAPREHRAYEWLPWREAAERVYSWSNRLAILALPAHHPGGPR